MDNNFFKSLVFSIAVLLISASSVADGVAVGKVYMPYVYALEKELEYRMRYDQLDEAPNRVMHHIAYGQSLSDRLFAEFYIIAEDVNGEVINVEGQELELKWQVTEQGEYSADYGILLELERERGGAAWEAAAALLITKELGKYSLTTNIKAIMEWGDDIDREFESSLAIQAKYRWKQSLEPMLEFHYGEDTTALGPMIGGTVKSSSGPQKFYWQTGVLAGLQSATPDVMVKASLEYEF